MPSKLRQDLRNALKNGTIGTSDTDTTGISRGINETDSNNQQSSERSTSIVSTGSTNDGRDKRSKQGNNSGYGSEIRRLVNDSGSFQRNNTKGVKEETPKKANVVYTKPNEIEDKVAKISKSLPEYFDILDRMLGEIKGDTSLIIWSNAVEEECISIAKSLVKLSTFWYPAVIVTDNIINGKDYVVSAMFFGFRIPPTVEILNPIAAYKRRK